VQAVSELCAAADVPCQAHTVEALHPWEAIIEHAKRMECDLLVMASHGRRGVSALLLGSETQKVLTHSKVPVLVVR
jgi:nucleotide-binding universal stress UspA family protein